MGRTFSLFAPFNRNYHLTFSNAVPELNGEEYLYLFFEAEQRQLPLHFKMLTMTDLTIYKNDFCISTDKTKLDVKAIHAFLSAKAYWCLNIPYETVKKAAENSLNFGVYANNEQIGYARIISDFSTIAYLGDLYILDEFRGRGISKWLMETIMSHSELQDLRRWILLTGDAHGLYRQFGWTDIADSSKWMELHNKNVYSK